MFTPDYYVNIDGTVMMPQRYFCKSSDTKPTDGIPNGSDCIEMDTSRIYFFDAGNSAWIEFESSGGAHKESVTGTDPEITGTANTVYICGEVDTLSITPPDSGIIDVVFESGSTPTVLTLPNTVVMPDWWTGVEASRIYEISIMDGTLAVVTSWAAS